MGGMKEPSVETFGMIKATLKSGNEQFHFAGRNAGFDLYSFWRWSVSDLVSNATRGRLAEFIVASAVKATSVVRSEWDAFDLETPSRLKVEVKSAAYVQSWFQKKLSSISFLCKATHGWNAETNCLTPDCRRWADVYVFALLHHRTQATIDPLDLEQWEFYVVGVDDLNERRRSQHSITLKSLQAKYDAVKYVGLAEAVEAAALSNHANAAVALTT
jgi:hypothetical protein